MPAEMLSFEELSDLSQSVVSLRLRSASPRFSEDEQKLFEQQAEMLEKDLKILVRARFEKNTAAFKSAKNGIDVAVGKLNMELQQLKKASEVADTVREVCNAIDGLLELAAGLARRPPIG